MNNIISLAHGGGGTLQNDLIREEILKRFSDPLLAPLPDGAITPEGIVFSSDSFVVTPRFFKGGDIGKLAVTGTVNDLLMAGGIPRYLSCSLIIEEGLSLEELQKILDSMKETADACHVSIITGDTKVVPRGAGDGIYINTSGIGFKRSGMKLGAERIGVGDKIIVSGAAGEHGLSILAERYGLESGTLASDCAFLGEAVEVLFKTAGEGLKFMRDATRGGVWGIVKEIFENAPCGVVLDEEALPVTPEAAAVSKLLGVDPGFAACEGCFAAVLSADAADRCVATLRELPRCRRAAVIGTAAGAPGETVLKNSWGALRELKMPAGDQLPRIC